MNELTLDSLEQAFTECERHATPHRTPDFKALRRIAKDGGETPVSGTMVFVEEHNTGYAGNLERWWFSLETKGEGTRMRFWADMMPGQITTK